MRRLHTLPTLETTLRSQQRVRVILLEKPAVSLPRHSCDKRWHSSPWNQTLRKNAEFIYKTGDHKSPTIGQRFQRIFYDFLWRLVNEAKSSMAVFRFSPVAIGKNPPRAECDHPYCTRSEFLLKT